jgi:hypothetical protein
MRCHHQPRYRAATAGSGFSQNVFQISRWCGDRMNSLFSNGHRRTREPHAPAWGYFDFPRKPQADESV